MDKKYAIATVIMLVLLAGCGQKEAQTIGKPFIGGTGAVVTSFTEGTPPPEIYDGGNQPFDVVIKLENKGEYDIPKENLKVTLSGINPAQFSNPAIEKNMDEDLKGAYLDPTGNAVAGGQTYITFSGFNYMDKLSGNTPFTIRADVCYAYGTTAQFMLCVKKDLSSTSQGVCNVNEAKQSECSSAPVQIGNVKEEVAGTNKISFYFDVTYQGTGAISKEGSNCDDKVASKDKIFVEVETGLSGLKCSGLEGGDSSGYIALYGGTRNIRCTQDITGTTTDFNKPVTIKARYDHKEFIDKNIIIKHGTG